MFNLFRLCRQGKISFDIIAKNGNNVEVNSTLSKRRNLMINSFDIVAVFGNKVESCFDIVAAMDDA